MLIRAFELLVQSLLRELVLGHVLVNKTAVRVECLLCHSDEETFWDVVYEDLAGLLVVVFKGFGHVFSNKLDEFS